jgi:hypothetical protein
MEQMMDAFFEMKDGMPAKFNFLGGILTTALNALKPIAGTALKSVLPMIGDAFSNKEQTIETKHDKLEDKKVKILENDVNKLTQKLDLIIEKFNYINGSNGSRKVARNTLKIKPIKSKPINTRSVKLSRNVQKK